MIDLEPNSGFVKYRRSKEVNELLKAPIANALLCQIVLRAKRTKSFSVDGLEVGEALIGDYKSVGASYQQYRTAVGQLERWGLVTIRTTNKGSIAKLIDKRVFDINQEGGNEQNNHQTTNKKRTDNEQTTTNKNERRKKRKKYSEAFESFWRQYPKKVAKIKAFSAFQKIDFSEHPLETIIFVLQKQKNSEQWKTSQYIPNPTKWLEEERWLDEFVEEDSDFEEVNY